MSIIRNIVILVLLLVLLAANIGLAFLPFGLWRLGLHLILALLCASLIIWFYMDFRSEGGLVRLAGGAFLTIMLVMLIIFASDFGMRGIY